jgi:small subunit ribosomal protein S17
MTAATQPASRRKTKTGRVVSDKMDKTIVVSVERLARHPLYKRVIRLTTKFKAHDETNDAHVGDTVLIEESRPLSATKRWKLVRVVQRAGDHGSSADLVGEEEAVSEVIHAAAHPGRTRSDAATSEASDASGDADATPPSATESADTATDEPAVAEESAP